MDHTPSDMITRLTAIEPEEIDGRLWWEFRRVCDALRLCDRNAAGRLIAPEHKRRKWLVGRDWRMKKAIGLIDRYGVEALVIRHCRDAPRGEIMAALDERWQCHDET